MKRKTRLDYIPEAIRYLCLAVVFVLGIFSILATGGGGGGSSGSSSGTAPVSEARVTVLTSDLAANTPIPGARVRGVFLYQDTNVTEESNCVTGTDGKCVVTVAMTGQLADEVTLTVTQPTFNTMIDKETLDSTGSINVIIRMTPK
jgi:hypothetical protein